mmetsp:Transcript_151062/g.266628  ORF Transcript_151062/g.266628 Transcript_151062/m.266628 type:complete len:258 (-) Transcript_151062:15-788(-)
MPTELFDFNELDEVESDEKCAVPEALVFYDSWQSSCAWRIRLVLCYKGLPYETRQALLPGGEIRGSPVRDDTLNPMKQVPFLLAEGWESPLGQSIAIAEYLDEVAPDPPLLPGSRLTRARLREMVEVVNSFIQPKQPHGFKRGLGALEALASRSTADGSAGRGPYLGGIGQPSLADFCLVPQLGNARSAKVDLAPYPTLLSCEAALRSHPVYEASHPKHVLRAMMQLDSNHLPLDFAPANLPPPSMEELMTSRWPQM